MTTTRPIGVLVSLLAVQAWEDSHGLGDIERSSYSPHARPGRHRSIAEVPTDRMAVDPSGNIANAAPSSVAGTPGHRSRLAVDSSGSADATSEDEAVLSEMGLGDHHEDRKADKPATPAFIRRESLYDDEDKHPKTEEGDELLQEDLDMDAAAGFWDRRRRRRRVDCTYTTWTGWSDCTLTCSGGVKQQKRATEGPYHGGQACHYDYTLKEEACNSDPCPVNCRFTPWGGWGGCSKSCATGQKRRTREEDGPFHGGVACVGTTAQATDCNTFNCPEDCYFEAWSSFGACSKTCIADGVYGYKTRDRGKVGPFYGGKACVGHASDDGLCNTFTCPYDCTANEWGAWSVCSQTCSVSIKHHGYHIRSRTSTAASNGGRQCSNNVQMVHCNTQLCPADCYWLVWGAWGPCSKTCDPGNTAAGIRIRVRDKVGPAGSGKDCEGETTSTTACNSFSCPVDCTFQAWGSWGMCSKTCDTGIRTRQRGKNEAQFGGADCVGKTQHSEMCESWSCPVDCRWTLWDAWMPCTKSCGGGNAHRSRAYDPKPTSGGTACAGAHMEMIDCSADPCPIDCAWEEWLDWSLCSTSCGKGLRTRVRLVRIQATYGGEDCDHEAGAVHEDACPEQFDCPMDCRFDEWGEWDMCNASCDEEGHKNSNRTLLTAENGGSSVCPEGPLNRAMECTGKLCGPILKAGAHPRLRLAVLSLLWSAPFLLSFF